MNTKLIAIIVAVVLIGGGVAAYFLTQSKDSEGQGSTAATTSQESAPEKESITGSIKNLLLAGNARKCTYNDGESSGALYFTNDKKLRTDYVTTVPEPSSGSMIMVGDKQHIWDNATKEGITTQLDPSIFSDNDEQEQMDVDYSNEEDAVDIEKDMNFNCERWSVDESLFTPPTDVKFTDMTALMQQLQQ